MLNNKKDENSLVELVDNNKTEKLGHNETKKNSTVQSIVPHKHYKNDKNLTKFKYGNYDRYYGYRNADTFTDIRLEAFQDYSHLFCDKTILDIGCNNGLISMAIAKQFNIKSIVGLDIDKTLINRARQKLTTEKKAFTNNNLSIAHDQPSGPYPHNVYFKQGNYVLPNATLLDLEKEQFDTILCLSLTKWIHLNNGDDGLKMSFKRMYKQLRPGGCLILEAQDWKSYKRRKKLTKEIAEHFKNIKLLPAKFDEYLLCPEVGFKNAFSLKLPKHSSNGFSRPIKVIFYYIFVIFFAFFCFNLFIFCMFLGIRKGM